MFCSSEHFMGWCDRCDASALSRMSKGEVERKYQVGLVKQYQYEAYTYLWATLYPRPGGPDWSKWPTDRQVSEFTEVLYAHYQKRQGERIAR